MAIIIRADASAETGGGHVLRCLAIAQARREASERVVYVTATLSDALQKRLRDAGAEVRTTTAKAGSSADIGETRRAIEAQDTDLVVLDGYAFGVDFEAGVSAGARTVMVIDDFPRSHSEAVDTVVNPNVHAAELAYPVTNGNRLLLGPRYALLRSEFQAWATWERPPPRRPRRILVAFGGADYRNATRDALQALASVATAAEIHVLIGPESPYIEPTRALAHDLGATAVVDGDVPAEMAWADWVVLPPSTIALEALFMRLPFVAVVTADNQMPSANWLERHGVAPVLRPFSGREPEARAAWNALATVAAGVLSAPGGAADSTERLVDGCGVARVLAASATPGLTLHRARDTDARMLWEWANDPETRAASFTPEPIAWETHVDWMQRTLNDPTRVLCIARTRDGTAVGQVRFDVRLRTATMSVSVAPSRRGNGEGTALIATAASWALQDLDIDTIVARVKRANVASLRAFEAAGFVRTPASRGPLTLRKSR